MERLNLKIRERSFLRTALLIFLLSVLIRTAIVFATKVYLSGPIGEEVDVAMSIAQKGVFGNPFAIPTGPTAHVTPIYPMLLAAILKICPPGPAFTWVMLAISVLSASLLWASLPTAAVLLNMDFRVGVAAGILGAVSPMRHLVELDGSWDSLPSALGTLGLVVLAFQWRAQPDYRRAAVFGLMSGAMLLFQPAFLQILVALLLVFIFDRWRVKQGLQAVKATILIGFTILLVLVPWIVRNYLVFDALIPLRSNLGLELDISNNDRAYPDMRNNLHANQASSHPDVNEAENKKMAAMGEAVYYNARKRRALAWIGSHPGHFLRLTTARIFEYWVPVRRSLPLTAVEALMALAAWSGLALLIRRRNPIGAVFLAIFLAQPLIYYLIQSSERYRFPIEWCIMLCVGEALFCAFRMAERCTWRQTGAPPASAAGARRDS